MNIYKRTKTHHFFLQRLGGLIFLLSFWVNAVAQDYTIAKLKLFADRQNVLIQDVTVDDLGFIWYLANGQIYRYDGYRSLDVLNTLADQRQHEDVPQRILIDHKNRLWMAGADHVSYLDLQTWSLREVDSADLPPLQDRMIGSISMLANGTLVFLYESGQILLLEDERFILVDGLHRLSSASRIKVVPQTVSYWEGKYWVGTSVGTLLSIDPAADHQTRYHQWDNVKQSVMNLLTHEQGLLLNVFPNKFYLYGADGSLTDFMPKGFSPSKDDFYVLSPGAHFHLFADSKWAYLLDQDLSVRQKIPMPLQNEFGPKHVVMHRDEAIVGTDEGILVVYPQTEGLSQLIPQNQSANKSVRGIYVYPDGAYFYSTYQGAGFVESDGQHYPLEQLRHAYVIYPAGEERLFIGTEGGFIKVFDRQSRQLRDLPIIWKTPGGQLVDNPKHVMSVAENDTHYLIGSLTGLWLLEKTTQVLSRAVDRAGAPFSLGLHIRHILPLDPHTQLLSTNMGLYEYSQGNWHKRYPEDNNLGVYKAVRMGDTLWLATQGKGVVGLDKDFREVKAIGQAAGLSNDLVYSLEHAQGTLVAGTADGLNLIREGNIRIIRSAEGLTQSEFNASASFWDPYGQKMYVGGLMGYTVLDMTAPWFEPAESLEGFVTEVFVSSSTSSTLKADYTWPYRKERQLVLKPDESLAGLYMGLPGNYRANGTVNYVLEAGGSGVLSYSQFISLLEPSPGSYSLILETQNKGMLVHQKELIIQKEPHYYQTWWFQVFVGGLILLLLYGWYRSRINKIRDEQAIRNRIAADLHDEVGSLLTRIYFQVHAESPPYKRIADTSQQALSIMSDMVWSIDSQYDTLKDLHIRMKDFAYRIREEMEVRVQFEKKGEVGNEKVSQELRQNLFLIFKEALINAIKYGNGSGIHILLDVEKGIALRVQNGHTQNGQGIRRQQGGQGLVIMKQRVAKMKGELHIRNTEDVFEVQVYVPPQKGIGL